MSNRAALLLVFALISASFMVVAESAFSSLAVAENNWATKAPMHEARSNLGVATVNGKIYAIGGSTQNGSSPYTGGVVGTNEQYDPVTDTWVYKTPMPTPRQSFAITACQNKIYCIGGYNSEGVVVGVNEVYDPQTDTWETRASMATLRIALEANAANGKIYLIGGYIPGDYTTYTFSSSSFSEAYDPATNSWTTCAPMPTAASSYASAEVDDKIYFMGGVTNYSSSLNQIYDPKTDNWSQGATMPSDTAYAVAAVTSGVDAPKRIYVFQKGEGGFEAPYVPRVYDPKNDNWTFAAKLPTERYYFNVAALSDTFYVIGGKTEYYQYPALEVLFPPIITVYVTNEHYTPFGYGTVTPAISVSSPTNNYSYNETNVSLTFTVNKPAVWIGYSLDGQETVTVTGNMTLSGLSSGLHNLTVYANDTFGNMGESEPVTFIVDKPESTSQPEPFLTLPIVAVSVAVVAVVALGLLVYWKKRKR